MGRLVISILLLLMGTHAVHATDSFMYGLDIRNSSPEYGENPPGELCQAGKTDPCEMNNGLLTFPVTQLSDTRPSLSMSAWYALKRNASRGQEIWEFNLCQEYYMKNIVCVETRGYVVLKNYNVVFYTFAESRQP